MIVTNNSKVAEDLESLYAFVKAQFDIIKEKHDTSKNNVEMLCLAMTANVIVDVIDEVVKLHDKYISKQKE